MASTQADQLVHDFRKWTAYITAQPENYITWLGRSKFLRRNGYWRLAIADIVKSVRLARPSLPRSHGQPQLNVAMSPREEACEELVTQLLEIGALQDAIYYERYCHLRFRTSTELDMMKDRARGMETRRCFCEIFPWAPARSPGDILAARLKLWGDDLELKESTLSDGNRDNLGVFTTKKFSKGDVLSKEVGPVGPEIGFFERQMDRSAGALSAISRPDTPIPVQYRLASLDQEECLRNLDEKLSDPSPLNDFTWSTLSVNYSTRCGGTFNLKRDVFAILDLMEHKSPFHPHHDYWVILTMLWRFNNNRIGNLVTKQVVITKYGSLLNHSCEPNVDWVFRPLSYTNSVSVVDIVALRDIEEGEELFVNYVGDAYADDVRKRREVLETWLGDGILCQCNKCVSQTGGVLG